MIAPLYSTPALRELEPLKQWILWAEVFDPKNLKKFRKVPISPKTGKPMDPTNREGAGTYAQAFAESVNPKFKFHKYAGFGFIFLKDDPYIGIDLDNCVDESGKLSDIARRIVEALASYTEFSPSGRGLHIIVRADKLFLRCKAGGWIECYDHNRYFTFTGEAFEKYLTIEDRQSEVDSFFKEYFPDDKKPMVAKSPGGKYKYMVAWLRSGVIEAEKLNALVANSPDFAKAWNHQNKGQVDQSLSTYDNTLAFLGFHAGLSVLEVSGLIIRHRRKWAEGQQDLDKILKREDYFLDLICDAERLVSESKEEKLSSLDSEEWNSPEVIKKILLEVPPFPLDALPDSVRKWVLDVSERMQAPPDYSIISFLIFLSSIVGTRCGVRPKQHDNWTIIPNLWGAIIGPPSTHKTPSMQEGIRALKYLEYEADKVFKEAMNKYADLNFQYQIQKKVLESKYETALKGAKSGGDPQSILAEIKSLVEPELPILRRHSSNDCTVEKLGEILKENPEGLFIFRDELIGMLTSWDKPGCEGARAFFIESWTGSNPYTFDRIKRGTVYIPKVCLSILGGIQPLKIAEFINKAMTGGDNDGLLQRFQLMAYPDIKKNWENIDRAPVENAFECVLEVIRRLSQFDYFSEAMGANLDSDSPLHNDRKTHFLRFEKAEAQPVFNKWLTEHEGKLRGKFKNYHPVVIQHFGKYPSLMPSLALLLELFDFEDNWDMGGKDSLKDGISKRWALASIKICDYLEAHALRIYDINFDSGTMGALILCERILKKEFENSFSVRDIQRKGGPFFKKAEEIKAILQILENSQWLYLVKVKAGKRKTVNTVYMINPRLFEEPFKSLILSTVSPVSEGVGHP